LCVIFPSSLSLLLPFMHYRAAISSVTLNSLLAPQIIMESCASLLSVLSSTANKLERCIWCLSKNIQYFCVTVNSVADSELSAFSFLETLLLKPLPCTFHKHSICKRFHFLWGISDSKHSLPWHQHPIS
jgi:hypothetical protein